MRKLLLVALALMVAGPANAQDVRYDPASGDYFVTVYNDELEPVEMRVVPADKVEIAITPSLKPLPGDAVHFRYAIRVPKESRQALAVIDLPCPTRGWYHDLHATARQSIGSDWVYASVGGGYCSVILGTVPLEPGGVALQIAFDTQLLPGIGHVRAIGATGGFVWPTHDPIPQNDAAREFVQSVTGITGGWKVVPAVVPARAPSLFTDPADGLSLVQADLDQSCGGLNWISHRGICNSLRTKLEQAARSLDRGRTRSAKGQLRSFLRELDAQHGPEPGKHVDDNAYWLLKTNVEYLLSRL